MRHVARKRFGQHFLVDESVIDAIVGCVDPRPGDALVEIGPGMGALTWPLLERCGALTVVELDRDLAARLRAGTFSGPGFGEPAPAEGRPDRQGRMVSSGLGLTVIEADVLKVDFAALSESAGRRLRIVGNLPYNISTPILFHLADAADRVIDQHLMLQREVVQRIVATPGGKAYGRLSVMLQWRYEAEPVLDVPPQAFDPPPKVDSAVVRMRPRERPAAADAALLGEIVAVAFSQRRKLLRHTLGRWLGSRGAGNGFDLQRRAEEVPVDEYVELARRVAAGVEPRT